MAWEWDVGLLITPDDYTSTNETGTGFIGGNFSRPGGSVPYGAIKFTMGQNEKHYQNNKSEVSAHYTAPDSDNYLSNAMISFLIPEMARLPSLIADITKETMSSAEYKAIKTFALKNNVVAQVALAGSAISEDVNSGISPYVAIGTQATIIGFGAGLAIATAGLGIPLSLGIGLVLSIGLEKFNVQGQINNYLSSILGLPTSTANEGGETDGLTGYQVYQALMQILQNPDAYPDAGDMLDEFVAEAGAMLLNHDAFVIISQNNSELLNKEPPKTILMSDINHDGDGYRTYSAEGNGGYLFKGSEEYNKMIGGDGLNWFLIAESWGLEGWDFLTPRNIVTGGAGYNVLDFSNAPDGVHVLLGGNDYINQRINDMDEKFNSSVRSFLDEQMSRAMRGGADQWLNTDFWNINSGEYRNINLVIGSPYNDIIVGDWIGGNTLTGGYGDDIFVIHGGSNTIRFYDTDFSNPGEVIVRKTVHGLTLGKEALYFNGPNYNPTHDRYFRIDSDKLDFSGMDADLSKEGTQSFTFIGENEFSGAAGELRLDVAVAEKPTFTLQGDRTGNATADLEVSYEIYYTNPFVNAAWSPFITVEDLIL